MNRIDSVEAIPSGEHWAIVETQSIFIPGDERSRTAPGHGYPEHYENRITYIAFADEATFRAELERRLSTDAFLCSRAIRGLHVAATYSGKTVAVVNTEHAGEGKDA